MDGVFWSGEIGFVPDRTHTESSFPNAKRLSSPNFAEVLKSSGKLPQLGPAPVASWLLARLFELTRECLGFETYGRLLNDGGGYYIRLIAFTHDLKPAAFLMIHGDSTDVKIWMDCKAEFSPEMILQSLTEAVLESPNDLIICNITTIDTDPLDLDKRRFGKPEILGWDGKKFLGFQRCDGIVELP